MVARRCEWLQSLGHSDSVTETALIYVDRKPLEDVCLHFSSVWPLDTQILSKHYLLTRDSMKTASFQDQNPQMSVVLIIKNRIGLSRK